MVNRICKFCKEEKDESICLKGQNVCYDCNNKRRKEQRLKKLAEQTNNPKTCNVCNEKKTEKDFPVNCLQCKKCAKKIFVTNARKKTEDMKKQGITKKTCIKCEEERDIDKYRDGENVCNVCKNEMGKAWIDNNQEHFKKLCKKYRQKEGYNKKRNEYRREKYKNDENEKLSLQYRHRLRRYINSSDLSEKTLEKYKKIFGCSKSKFRKWIEFCFQDKMTWDNYSDVWNFDHIKPCSSFKLENEDELKKCFDWKNTCPIYCNENYRKYNNRDLITEEHFKAKVKEFEDKLKKEKATKKLKNGRSIKQDLKDTKENIKVKSKDKTKTKTKKVSKDIEIEDIINISCDEESCEKKTKKSKGKNIIKKN